MSSNINWNDTIKKEAEGIKGEDLGEVQDVSNGFVLLQKGIINKESFLIPQDLAESYDGDIVRFRISEDEFLTKYRKGSNTTANAVQTQTMQDVEISESEAVETIPLTEERLNVNKRVNESNTTITKEPVTETKTVEVPVTHEEVSIERRQPTGDTSTTQEPVTSREDIEIPLKSEEVEVSKTPYVKEEVVIKKKPVTETRQVTEEITSEQVNTSSM
ncbi:MAG TPA: YsnF/AvaK domain-containing protein [Nitrososphaeraceae archaeon]|nr:YsnF/AvaK domain-containing protein [Nitrososphaeraceae archaeon]